MKVLVLGATGTIGKIVALAFVRNGQEIFGQTRKSASPALSRMNRLRLWWESPWLSKYGRTVDVIIDACNPGENGVVALPILHEVLAHAKSRGPNYKLTFIFTSGTWTHGESIAKLGYISERGPLISPLDLVKWRAEYEARILSARPLKLLQAAQR
ncbi:hypothetical protein V1522DRAFT_429127 [Lipomyces starkeyi]